MESNVITAIQSKLNSPIKYRVVFDIDDVLCCAPIRLHYMSANKIKEIKERTQGYPGAIVIYWENEGSTYLHFFYPDLDKLMLSILSWSNWSIDFFSCALKDRDEEVIPTFLKNCIARHTDNADKHYEQILLSGRCRIFSGHHMKKNESDNKLKGFEISSEYKKDLTVISEDIDNTILVEDDRSCVPHSQYPFIGTSYSNSSKFKDNFLIKNNSKDAKSVEHELVFDPVKSPCYIMGILLSCKKLLDSGKCNSLRQALSLVLRHNGKTLAKGRYYSPWFLHPTTETGDFKVGLSSNSEYINHMRLWIKKAEEYCADKSLSLSQSD